MHALADIIPLLLECEDFRGRTVHILSSFPPSDTIYNVWKIIKLTLILGICYLFVIKIVLITLSNYSRTSLGNSGRGLVRYSTTSNFSTED